MFSGTKSKWLVLVAIAALAAIVIACGTDETSDVSDNGSGGVGAQPTAPADGDNEPADDPGYEVVQQLAPIESVQILVLESYPEQFVVQIISGLPSGCASFSHTDVTQDGTDIKISLYNTVPAPDQMIGCTAIYGMHEESVALGSDFERGTTYTVLVNDHPGETFTTGSSPVVGDPLPPITDIPGDDIVRAPVEGLDIIIAEDSRGTTTYYANVIWGLANGCIESLDRVVSRTTENSWNIDPLVRVPSGDVACTDNYRYDADEVYIGEIGRELTACELYTVTAGNEKVEFQAIAPNVRCADPGTATPTPAPPVSGGGSSIIADSIALELSLKAKGADVESGGQVDHSKQFGLYPTEYKVNGQQVLIYEFAPGSYAIDASKTVSTNGSEFKLEDGAIMNVHWIATSHFYLYGNAIIQYVGEDEEIVNLLDAVAAQFAGGGIDEGDVIDLGESEEDEDFTTKPAMIENVTIASTRSIPAQHSINVTMALGGSCETFNSMDWTVEGSEVYVEVLTQVPIAPVPCTLAIIYEDVSLNIGSGFEAGVEYDVFVNGERQGTFFGG